MLEVAHEGTLLEYLKRHRPGQQEVVMGRGGDEPVFMRKQTLTAQKLLCLLAHVATGLEHLHKYKVRWIIKVISLFIFKTKWSLWIVVKINNKR